MSDKRKRTIQRQNDEILELKAKIVDLEKAKENLGAILKAMDEENTSLKAQLGVQASKVEEPTPVVEEAQQVPPEASPEVTPV